jgi:hypothetical protein
MRDAKLVALCVVELPIIKCSENNNDSEKPPDLGKAKGKMHMEELRHGSTHF